MFCDALVAAGLQVVGVTEMRRDFGWFVAEKPVAWREGRGARVSRRRPWGEQHARGHHGRISSPWHQALGWWPENVPLDTTRPGNRPRFIRFGTRAARWNVSTRYWPSHGRNRGREAARVCRF